MPVFFDNPVPITTTASLNLQLVSLVDTNALPEEAAIAIMSYDNTSNTYGKWFCVDKWYPSVDEDTTIASVGWDMEPYERRQFLLNLGPEGSNNKKEAWVGYYYGAATPRVLGYFTYDEVVIFPEVTSDTRSDYTFDTDSDTGGWGSATSTVFASENIYSIPTMRRMDSRQPTGLIFDGTYQHITVEPKNADDTLLEESITPNVGQVTCLGGFDANGDVWVSSWGGVSALMGYFTIPIVWHLRDNTDPDTLDSWTVDNTNYLHTLDETASMIIVDVNQVSENLMIRHPSDLRDEIPYNYDTLRMRYRQDVIAEVDEDTHQALLYGEEVWEPLARNVVRGYFQKYRLEKCSSMDINDDLEIHPPEYYYPPDSIGSLHINYAIEGQEYVYSNINNLGLYLSGGASNTVPDDSLGGVKSTQVLLSGLNSLFDEGSEVDSYIGAEEFRCLYLVNNSGSEDAVGINIWVEKDNEEGNKIYIGEDPAGIDGTAQTTSTEDQTPTGVEFTLVYSEMSCYTVPILAPSESIAIWFKRSFANRSANNDTPDTVSLKISVLNNGV